MSNYVGGKVIAKRQNVCSGRWVVIQAKSWRNVTAGRKKKVARRNLPSLKASRKVLSGHRRREHSTTGNTLMKDIGKTSCKVSPKRLGGDPHMDTGCVLSAVMSQTATA